MSKQEFYIRQCTVWSNPLTLTDGFSTCVLGNPADQIPKSQRRRLKNFGRHAVGVALSGPDEKNLQTVFSSRYGDLAQTVDLLDAIDRRDILSPASFSMSVHNAVPGFLSILKGNKAPYTSVSAGRETFVAGLSETLTRINFGECDEVNFIYADTALPEQYQQFTVTNEGVSFVFRALISQSYREGSVKIRLERQNTKSQQKAADPVSHALSFLGVVDGKQYKANLAGERWGFDAECVSDKN